jgi:hypothetical protein
MNNDTNAMNREQWLTEASNIIRSMIIEPAAQEKAITFDRAVKVAVSIGHPKHKRALGECWHTEASEDKQTNQIFITPFNNDSLRILDVLTHELIHAYDNNRDGHKGRFALLARAVGLEGKLTATVAGDELKERLNDILDALGDIPHTKLDESKNGKKKQAARMLKIVCHACDFTMRASRTQATRISDSACCPVCGDDNYGILTRGQIDAA